MIVVSPAIFEKIVTRAEAVAEEMWRRMLFDNPGTLANASPEVFKEIHDYVVEEMATRYVDRLAERVANANDQDAA